MLPRLLVVLGPAFLAFLPALCGCSSSHRRDKNYGTDLGANYQIPDAANFPTQAGTSAADAAADAGADTSMEVLPSDALAEESGPGIDS